MFPAARNHPKVKEVSSRPSFDGWIKCSHCGEMIHLHELSLQLACCPRCSFHHRMHAHERVSLLADRGTFEPWWEELTSNDPLEFVDLTPYHERLRQAQDKTGLHDALVIGRCMIGTLPCVLGVMEFHFMGGSMGCVVGEKLTRAVERCIELHLPLVMVTTSGGARMQESTLSLMQMAKTAAALGRLAQKALPYISVLTNPTTGGVTASFAALGDLILAEPGALICFAGPRVIEQTMRQVLPAHAQRAEHLLQCGLIDQIVHRHELKQRLTTFLGYLHGS